MITANTVYKFKFKVNNLIKPVDDRDDPIIDMYIDYGTNHQLLTTTHKIPEVPDQWILFEGIWYSGAYSSNVELSFTGIADTYMGGDFGLDDIEFYEIPVSQTTCKDRYNMNFDWTFLGCNKVQFNDQTIIPLPGYSITNWYWDFGDGTTGTGSNPIHTYASAGTYTVTLSIETSDGCELFFTREITIEENSIVWRDFNGTAEINGRLKSINSFNNWCNSGKSTNSILGCEDGSVTMANVENTSVNRIFGLARDRSKNCYGDVDFGFRLLAGGSLHRMIGSNAFNLGTYSVNDNLKIIKQGNLIIFKQNGQIVSQYSNALFNPNEEIFVQAQIWDAGEELECLQTSSGVLDKFGPLYKPTWTNLTNTTVNSDGFLKAININNWCNEAESSEHSSTTSYDNKDFGLEYKMDPSWFSGNSNNEKIVGFSSTSGNCYGSIEYGFLITDAGGIPKLKVIEPSYSHPYNSVTSQFSIGDRLTIECHDNTIYFYLNCTLMHQTTIDRSVRYYVDAHIYYANDVAEDLYVWGLSNSFQYKDLHEPSNGSTTIEANTISLYPNPTTGQINITSEIDIIGIEVLNLQGQLVLEKNNINKARYRAELTDILPGVYVVRVKTKDRIKTVKVVVK